MGPTRSKIDGPKKREGGEGVEWLGYGVRGGERTSINEAGRRRVRNKTGVVTLGVCSRDQSAVNEGQG